MNKLVIPAEAGIQSAAVAGSRVKPGMTAEVRTAGFMATQN